MVSARIAHYYHAYAHPGWERIVDEYLDVLVGSGFAEAVGAVRLGVVGAPDERRSLVEHVGRRVPVTVVAEADRGWEQLTLNRMVATLADAELVVYAHTKSVTDPDPDDHVNVVWRREMLRVVIAEWRDRVGDMASCDSAGAFHMDGSPDQPRTRQIYGGNFWWARAELLRRLPPPSMRNRFGAEGWIGRVPHRMHDLMLWPF